MPVVICNIVRAISVLIINVMESTVSYLLILSGLAKSEDGGVDHAGLRE